MAEIEKYILIKKKLLLGMPENYFLEWQKLLVVHHSLCADDEGKTYVLLLSTINAYHILILLSTAIEKSE